MVVAERPRAPRRPPSHMSHTPNDLQVGNGLFWTFPFLLQWMVSRIIGSGLIDNGRLSDREFG